MLRGGDMRVLNPIFSKATVESQAFTSAKSQPSKTLLQQRRWV